MVNRLKGTIHSSPFTIHNSFAPRLHGRQRREIRGKFVGMKCFHIQLQNAEQRHTEIYRAALVGRPV